MTISFFPRRVYYDNATGLVLLDTGEFQTLGDVLRDTIYDDFNKHPVLAKRDRSTVGILEFDYGELRNEFSNAISKKVDVSQKRMIFDYTPLDLSEMIKEREKLEKSQQERINELEANFMYDSMMKEMELGESKEKRMELEAIFMYDSMMKDVSIDVSNSMIANLSYQLMMNGVL